MLSKSATKLWLAMLAGLLPWLGSAQSATTDAAPAKASASSVLSFDNPVIARAKGFDIKRSQLDDEFIRVKAQMAAQNQQLSPDQRSILEINLLQQLIGLRLISGQATEAEKTAGKATAEKRYEEAKARMGSDEMIKMRLKAENLTTEQLMAKWADQAAAEAVLDREFKVVISDEQAKKFYEENPGKFEQPEMVRASHILFGTRDKATQRELPSSEQAQKRKQAEAVLKRAQAGEDFAALAKEFSEDPGSKDKGGEYTFPKGRMVPEFEAAAWALKPGQVSDIVTTSFGYHIIKLSEKLPAKKVEYEKVADDLKKALKAQEIQKRIPAYVEKLKTDAGLEILDEKLRPPSTNAPAGLGVAAPSLEKTK
jgi:peptidyl-prolyl cis-trans isomerase C